VDSRPLVRKLTGLVLNAEHARGAAEAPDTARRALAGSVPPAGQGACAVQRSQQRKGRSRRQHFDPPFEEHRPEAVGRNTGWALFLK
jgi:hypothetical protein